VRPILNPRAVEGEVDGRRLGVAGAFGRMPLAILFGGVAQLVVVDAGAAEVGGALERAREAAEVVHPRQADAHDASRRAPVTGCASTAASSGAAAIPTRLESVLRSSWTAISAPPVSAPTSGRARRAGRGRGAGVANGRGPRVRFCRVVGLAGEGMVDGFAQRGVGW
jgi:hypothetical protein